MIELCKCTCVYRRTTTEQWDEDTVVYQKTNGNPPLEILHLMKNSLITFGLFINLHIFSLSQENGGYYRNLGLAGVLHCSPDFISPQIMQVKSSSFITKIFNVMTFFLRYNTCLLGVGEAIMVCNIPWPRFYSHYTGKAIIIQFIS